MEKIVILGASGHARVVADIVIAQGAMILAGFVDRDPGVGGPIHGGLGIIGTDDDLPALMARLGILGGIVAVGDNFRRRSIEERLLARCPDFCLAIAIHPRATVAADVSIGPGSVVMAGAVINPGARVGRSCIVNTNASLDHDSTMGDFASLAPGVVTGGNVRIGAGAALGIGAIVRHGVTIGEDAVVGAGSIVMRDVAARSVSYGQPCRWVRDRRPGDPYL